jgi:uncharacterized protein
MKKQLLFLTLLTISSLMYAAATAPAKEERAKDEQELRRAALLGNVGEVKRLLLPVHDINVNAVGAHGYTALILAALHGNKEIVEMLLKDPKINVNAANNLYNTALIYAAIQGNKDIVEMLLHAGADKTLKNKGGETAEQLARDKKHIKLADYIRDYEPSRQLTKSAKKR